MLLSREVRILFRFLKTYICHLDNFDGSHVFIMLNTSPNRTT